MRERSKMKTRERDKIMKKAKLSIPRKKNRETTFFLIIFPDRERDQRRGRRANRVRKSNLISKRKYRITSSVYQEMLSP